MRPLQKAEYPSVGSKLPADEPAHLPLVSVIIVNYNYGRFLHQAAASVLEQTYPNVECIIVDNASTDESSEILDQIATTVPQVKIIRRASNDGQTPASLDGLAASSGAYVIFLDADDTLLPQGIDLHILVHLSLRIHVGFTSGDMLQVADGQVVVSTGEELNRYVQTRKGKKKNICRPYLHPYGLAWPPAELAQGLAEKIHFVPPLQTQWVWSPTSGNCYRRDALLLFSGHPPLAGLRTGTDMYFARGISALCGSVLIDAPVFNYRIHGGNIFTRHAQLNRTLCYQPGGAGDNNDNATLMLIDHLVDNAPIFAQNEILRWNFLVLLYRLDVPDPRNDLPRWQQRSRLAQKLAAQHKKLAPILGPLRLKFLMLRLGVPLKLVFGMT